MILVSSDYYKRWLLYSLKIILLKYSSFSLQQKSLIPICMDYRHIHVHNTASFIRIISCRKKKSVCILNITQTFLDKKNCKINKWINKFWFLPKELKFVSILYYMHYPAVVDNKSTIFNQIFFFQGRAVQSAAYNNKVIHFKCFY